MVEPGSKWLKSHTKIKCTTVAWMWMQHHGAHSTPSSGAWNCISTKDVELIQMVQHSAVSSIYNNSQSCARQIDICHCSSNMLFSSLDHDVQFVFHALRWTLAFGTLKLLQGSLQLQAFWLLWQDTCIEIQHVKVMFVIFDFKFCRSCSATPEQTDITWRSVTFAGQSWAKLNLLWWFASHGHCGKTCVTHDNVT